MKHSLSKILFKIFLISLIIFIISTFLYGLGSLGFFPHWWEIKWIGLPGGPGISIPEEGPLQGIIGLVKAFSFLFVVVSFILWIISIGVNKFKSSKKP